MVTKWLEGALLVALGVMTAIDLVQRFRRPVHPHVVYTVPEVARALRVPVATVERLIDEGRLTGRRIGGQVRVLGRSVLDYLAKPVAPVRVPVEVA